MANFLRKIFAVSAIMVMAALASCDDEPSPVTPGNSPPTSPHLPVPEDSATYARETLAVSWECSDPDGDMVVYTVQVRENDDYLVFSSQTPYKSMETGLFLLRDAMYTWRVTATDGLEITEGDWWTFFTPEWTNEPPQEPGTPSPADGSADVQISGLHLTWSASDPDEGDVLTYAIFFGTGEDPPLAASGLTETSWAAPVLEFSTQYNWYIVATDSHGESAAGPVWSFSTRPQPGGFTTWLRSVLR